MKKKLLRYPKMSIIYNNKWMVFAIILLSIFVAFTFGIRCYYQEPIGDEVSYEYVWEKDDPEILWGQNHRFERRVRYFNEIVQSQIMHYKIANGRSLVHAGEQAFTDHMLAFSVFNTFIFMGLVGLICLYCVPLYMRNWFPLWLLIFIILLYLFPEYHLWTSINLAPNYLWPSFLAVLILWVWDKIEEDRLKKTWIPFVIILSAIFGWTHEGFVIGVGGAIFIYYCLNLRKINNRVLCMAIPMYITGAFMIFSPGNIHRFFGGKIGNSGLIGNVLNGLLIFGDSILFWFFIICFIILIFTKGLSQIKIFLTNNLRLTLVILISFFFSLLANTLPHSFTYVLLFLTLLFFRGLTLQKFILSLATVVLSICISIIFIFNQSAVARDEVKNFKFQHSVIERYIESQSGIVEYDEPNFSVWTRSFLKRWNLNEIRAGSKYNVWNRAYLKGKKPPLFLYPNEYRVITDSTIFYSKLNRVPGNANAFGVKEGQWLWILPQKSLEGKLLQATLKPVDFSHRDNVMFLNRIKFALFPDDYPSQNILDYDTINSEYGVILRIHTPFVRKVERLDFIDVSLE